MSNYARLIQAEQVYKFHISQLEEEVGKLKTENEALRRLIDPLILDEYENGEYNEPEILEGEIVEDNSYEPPETVGPSWCLICGEAGFNENEWVEHRKTCTKPEHKLITTELGWMQCVCGYEPESHHDATEHINQ